MPRLSAIFLVLALILQVGTADAQTDYLPLETGNMWTYFEVLEPPFEPPDTLFYGGYEVGASVVVNDTAYYEVDLPYVPGDVRADDGGRIWTRIDGRELLLFDFSLGDGETYSFPFDDEDEYVVTVHRGLTVETHTGTYTDCITIFFDVPEWVDEEFGLTFAPGVGILQTFGGSGSSSLYSATVGGTTILDAKREVPRDIGLSLDVYPNPVRNEVTFEFDAPHVGSYSAAVFDVTGRRITNVESRVCAAGRCRIDLRTVDLAPGLYLARVNSGLSTESRTMIVVP